MIAEIAQTTVVRDVTPLLPTTAPAAAPTPKPERFAHRQTFAFLAGLPAEELADDVRPAEVIGRDKAIDLYLRHFSDTRRSDIGSLSDIGSRLLDERGIFLKFKSKADVKTWARWTYYNTAHRRDVFNAGRRDDAYSGKLIRAGIEVAAVADVEVQTERRKLIAELQLLGIRDGWGPSSSAKMLRKVIAETVKAAGEKQVG